MKTVISGILCAMLLTLASDVVHAQPSSGRCGANTGWSAMGEDAEGHSLYIHLDSMEMDGSYAGIWIKTVYKKMKKEEGDSRQDVFARESRTLFSLDCRNETISVLSNASCGENGEAVSNGSTEKTEYRSPPDSVSRFIVREFCRAP